MCTDDPRIEKLDDALELNAEQAAEMNEEAYEERALDRQAEGDMDKTRSKADVKDS